MGQNPKIPCPQCGCQTFKVSAKPNRLDDLDGAVCERCNRRLSKHDIDSWLKRQVQDVVSKAFKNLR
ncbi:ECs_2282 family putative zinc-binding protein [Methylomagnum ishizawai]|uniref:ECs_2282 family putative zinc-binding protein n=1 Tax=Methylomagnum ishizawai TaxID=1760988 RepID=UPI003CCEE4D0